MSDKRLGITDNFFIQVNIYTVKLSKKFTIKLILDTKIGRLKNQINLSQRRIVTGTTRKCAFYFT